MSNAWKWYGGNWYVQYIQYVSLYGRSTAVHVSANSLNPDQLQLNTAHLSVSWYSKLHNYTIT